jgi:hypothetical protein
MRNSVGPSLRWLMRKLPVAEKAKNELTMKPPKTASTRKRCHCEPGGRMNE